MKKRKVFVTLMALAVMVSMITGCASSSAPKASNTDSSNQVKAADNTQATQEEKKPTLKILNFYANFDPNENSIKKDIEERTGYSLEFFMLPQDAEKADEKLNIAISSGAEYDILKLRPYQYYRLAQ